MLIVLLLIATPVFAEGEDPPTDESAPAATESTQETTSVESEVAAVTEEATETTTQEPIEEPTPAESTDGSVTETSTEETPNPEPSDDTAAETDTEAPGEETVNEEIVEEAAVQAPAALETELVNAEGEALDLASQESAELLASGDPYYTVGTDTYHFYDGAGPAGCATDPFCFEGIGSGVIQFAIDYMSTSGLPSDRKLYV